MLSPRQRIVTTVAIAVAIFAATIPDGPVAVAEMGCGPAQVWQQTGSIPINDLFERSFGPIGGTVFVRRVIRDTNAGTLSRNGTDLYDVDGNLVRHIDSWVTAASENYAYGWDTDPTVQSVDIVDPSGDLVGSIPESEVLPSDDGTVYGFSTSGVTRYTENGSSVLASIGSVTRIEGIGGSYLVGRSGDQWVSVDADLSASRPFVFSPAFDDRVFGPPEAGFGANDGFAFLSSQRETPIGENSVLVDDVRLDVFDLESGQLVSELLPSPDEWTPSVSFAPERDWLRQ